ncbi:hypothetical protein NB693_24565 [Pantoea ananatis]|uniref:hypothetical protein n=1 Tax=Pantoea ananas TaxID=553 RepID=UPI00221FFFC9|nr:hypothetical protein [Pantoea ananatis]
MVSRAKSATVLLTLRDSACFDSATTSHAMAEVSHPPARREGGPAQPLSAAIAHASFVVQRQQRRHCGHRKRLAA